VLNLTKGPQPPRPVRRSAGPPKKLRDDNCRKLALPFLLSDFENRCAYSMQHISRMGDPMYMEVDHFNPDPKGYARNDYRNLFPASRRCNNCKSNEWPTPEEIQQGIRFLNCCEEEDYGPHIWEDPSTHLLDGTPAGRYHILMCDLNTTSFVEERTLRAENRRFLADPEIVAYVADAGIIGQIVRRFVDETARMIPPIPYREKTSEGQEKY
jgi:hypothetical protein